MLKLKCINHKSGLYWYDLIDEFSKQSWNGRTFNSLKEAIKYCKDTDNGQYDKGIFMFYPEYEVEKK